MARGGDTVRPAVGGGAKSDGDLGGGARAKAGRRGAEPRQGSISKCVAGAVTRPGGRTRTSLERPGLGPKKSQEDIAEVVVGAGPRVEDRAESEASTF